MKTNSLKGLHKILVVDDNKEIRKLIREIIESSFVATVVEAQDGVDANWKMSNENIDILITDLKMPKVSGIELIIAMKNNPLIYQPRFTIIISGAVDERMVKSFSEKGLKTIPKPINAADLVTFLTMIGLTPLPEAPEELSQEQMNMKKKLYQKKIS